MCIKVDVVCMLYIKSMIELLAEHLLFIYNHGFNVYKGGEIDVVCMLYIHVKKKKSIYKEKVFCEQF